MLSFFRQAPSTDPILEALDRSQAIIEFTPDGTILKANDNFLKTMGYRREEIIGGNHSLFVDPHYAESDDYKAFWQALRSGQFQSASFKRYGKGKRAVWIQAIYNPILNKNGEVERVVKFATDITLPTVKAQEAIDRTQATISFKLDGTILDANSAFLQTMGYRLDEVVGKHHSMFVDRAYASSPDYARFWDNLRTGQFQAGEFERVGKGGRQVWINASYNPVFDLAGRPEKVVKYATDITASKQIAAETREVADQVASATENMSTSVGEIAQNMVTTRDTVNDAAKAANLAEQDIEKLMQTTASMGGILEVIAAISGQIDMLALNARIEAARAGEAGRGFAVVADEVKKLAGRTTEATQTIEADIRGVQGLAGEMGKTLKHVAQLMAKVSGGANSVAAATEQQADAVSKIVGQVGQLNELIAGQSRDRGQTPSRARANANGRRAARAV
jgi:methyl-accepting chemotaxis protein